MVQTQYSIRIQKLVLSALVKKYSFSCPIVRESSLWCDGVSKIIGHVKTCAEGTNKKEKNPHLGFKQQQMQTVWPSKIQVFWDVSLCWLEFSCQHFGRATSESSIRRAVFDPEEGGITLLQYIGW